MRSKLILALTLIATLIVTFTPVSNFSAYCQDTKAEVAVSMFEKKVAEFKHFLSQERPLVFKDKTHNSPTGYRYVFLLIGLMSEVSYDIQKTNSLVSPYMAYIKVALHMRGNMKCGDVVRTLFDQKFVNGYSTYEKAERKRYENECYNKGLIEVVHFNFVYQKQQWVFKGATLPESGDPVSAISKACGKLDAPDDYVEDENNKAWEALVK